MTERAALYSKATRHLSRKCPVMKTLISRVGKCTWAPELDDPLTMLVRCVVSQQISTKAATSIFAKFATAIGGLPISPAALAAFTEADFRLCGISGPKQRTIRAVLSHVEANPDLLSELDERDEETLRAQLTQIKGIGPWSADMFLMFGLGKLDVLPVGDLGLRMGVRDQYGLKEVPSPKEVLAIGEKWKPYCSIATWYMWRSRGFVPQSGE